MTTSLYIGIDGGGTRTTLGLGNAAGEELARRSGGAGIVDPRRPLAAAEALLAMVDDLLSEAGIRGPVEALCAGLAGTGNATEREAVQGALLEAGVAHRVMVCSDGEIALEGALMGRAGVLLVGGTGSVGWGRGEDGRIARCGGWGMNVGDEGSAYSLARGGLIAALRAYDGRGRDTLLLSRLLEAIGAAAPDAVPSWVGRAEKAGVAQLARIVVEVAEEGDGVAMELLRREAAGLAEHAVALAGRLGPWSTATPVVLHGGLAALPLFAEEVGAYLRRANVRFEPAVAAADAVTGALRLARGAPVG